MLLVSAKVPVLNASVTLAHMRPGEEEDDIACSEANQATGDVIDSISDQLRNHRSPLDALLDQPSLANGLDPDAG